ncbi:DoxX family protein [Bradyrhizobium sp. LHD-71]|uniref:DoxX family protein n=1 Tax=Bradyrhizobium sp. LHD-71 TaxID=3072141 RepID=UPI00280EF357|nr:DoxX family protein [Bradyrhizobium sp. LHD-71]MDQ8726946.1 DoxX family protein [Bradyrhizobium sp. LHD-71]
MHLDSLRAAWSPRLLSILRIMTALLLLQYGMAKLVGFPVFEYLNNVPRFSLPWVAGLLELFGGALLLIGLFTSPVAFILSGLMAFAYFLGHAPKGFYPLTNGGTLAVLFCFVFLYFACAGGGAWSADAMLRRK